MQLHSNQIVITICHNSFLLFGPKVYDRNVEPLRVRMKGKYSYYNMAKRFYPSTKYNRIVKTIFSLFQINFTTIFNA